MAFSAAGFGRHLHKGETFRASGIAICDDLSRFNLADRAEHIAKVSFCGLEPKVSNEFLLPSQQYTLQIQIHECSSRNVFLQTHCGRERSCLVEKDTAPNKSRRRDPQLLKNRVGELACGSPKSIGFLTC